MQNYTRTIIFLFKIQQQQQQQLQQRQARQAREYLGQQSSPNAIQPQRRVTSSDIVGPRREPPQSPSMKMLNLTYSYDRPEGKKRP